VPDRRSIFRLLALAGFLLTVALALWLAELRPLAVIIVMSAALAVAWLVEWLSWRQEALVEVDGHAEGDPMQEHPESEPGADVPKESFPPPILPPAPVPEAAPPSAAAVPIQEASASPREAPEPEPAPPPEPVRAPTPEPSPEPEPAPEPIREPEPEPEPEPGPTPEPALATPAEPEPVPVPAAPPVEAPRPLAPVPSPPVPDPLPPAAAEPERPAAASDVVDLRLRATVQPRQWNLWDLERRARDESHRDPDRYTEWSYLFVHLRQFATPDGSLPTEFDGLVRESFGDLLEHAG
jgi:hypothetical protein